MYGKEQCEKFSKTIVLQVWNNMRGIKCLFFVVIYILEHFIVS